MLQTFRRVVTPAAVSAAVLAAATALVYGSPQASRPAGAGGWTVGRTPAGHPDLQGVWTNYDQTPFAHFVSLAGALSWAASHTDRRTGGSWNLALCPTSAGPFLRCAQ